MRLPICGKDFFLWLLCALFLSCAPARADFDASRTDNNSEKLKESSEDFRRYFLSFYTGIVSPQYKGQLNIEAPSEKDANGRPRWFDGRNGAESMDMITHALVQQSRFGDIERTVEKLRKTGAQMADGRMLSIVFAGSAWQAVRDTPTPEKTAREWRREIPNSSLAASIEASLIFDAAWKARGSGYADNVKPEQWEKFHLLMLQANKILGDAKSYRSVNPVWCQVKLETIFHLSKISFDETLKYCARKNPHHGMIFVDAMTFSMPKWGGTWRDVDDLARLAAAAARERDGDANYARAYWNLLQRQGTPNKNIFQDTEVSWQLMKKGFEDLVARYPHSAWVVNAFAGFSCLAGDKSTFREIWPRIGAYLDHRAWPEKAQPEACVKKLIGSPS